MNRNNSRQRPKQGPKAQQPRRLPVVRPPALVSKPKQVRSQRPLRVSLGGAQRQVSAAAAYSTGQSTQPPVIVASRDRARIVHRELVSSIVGTAGFVSSSLSLNPGLPATFPWLSTQAQGWEQYHFNKLRFCYYTRTGSSTPGSVMMVPDYDAADVAPTSEQVAAVYEDTSEDVPWKDITCDLRVDAMHPMGPKKYIRTGALTPNLDIKTYDVGNLFVCTLDGTAVNWGKLWVEYDITLFTPQLNPLGGGVLASEHFVSTNAPNSSNFMGGGTPTRTGSAICTVAGNVMTFLQAGQFLVNYLQTSTTTSQSSVPTVGSGAAIVAAYFGGGSVAGSGTAQYNVEIVITTVVGSTLNWALTTVGGLTGELVLAQMPSGSL